MQEKQRDKEIRKALKESVLPKVSERHWERIWGRIEESRSVKNLHQDSGKITTRPLVSWKVVVVGMAATFFLGLGLGLGLARFSNPDLNQNATPVQPTVSRPAAKVTAPQKHVRLTSGASQDEEEGLQLLGLQNVRVQKTDFPHQYKLVGKTQRGIPVIWSYTRETTEENQEGEQS